jgi:hypothetical protein
MPWGGVRPGSGRPKGSRAERVAKLAIEVATSGIQPIEVVLSVMRHAWEQQDYKAAAAMAEVALLHHADARCHYNYPAECAR